MNSLVSYGSDDNSDDSGDERYREIPGYGNMSKSYRKPGAHEDNYEEVGMDMSEDSNDSNSPPVNFNPKKPPEEDKYRGGGRQQNQLHARSGTPPPNLRNPSTFERNSSRERRSRSKSPNGRKAEEKRYNRDEDRNRSDDRYSRGRRDDNRGSRDSDRGRDSRSYRDDGRGKEKERYKDERRDSRRDDRSSKEDKFKDRRDKDRRRSKSKERRRSRSPRRSPRRSRSGSREREPTKGFSRRDRANTRMDRLDKLGIEFKPDSYPASACMGEDKGVCGNNSGNNASGDRFFIPGITGRFRDQIEKRKMLWQKAKAPELTPATSNAVPNNGAPGGSSKATKVYEATTFADDKTSCKFKRLMGIKDAGVTTSSEPVKSTDLLKKQEEMFSSMEAQYEVARTATHTMRGVGLGFGSFQR